MLKKNKKGSIPIIKTIFILLITMVILLSFTLMLMKTTGITIEEKKIQTQIIQNKIFNSNCFSNEYGIIEEDKFNQDNFNDCFMNLPPNIAFLTQIEKKGQIGQIIYLNKAVYEEKVNYCIINSNIFCTDIKYPITLKSNSGELSQETLRLIIIVN